MNHSEILFHNDTNIRLSPRMRQPHIESNSVEYGIFKLVFPKDITIPIVNIRIKYGLIYDNACTKEWHTEFMFYNLCDFEEYVFYIGCDKKHLYDVEIELDCGIEELNTVVYYYPPLIDVITHELDITDISSYYENPVKINEGLEYWM